MERLYSLEFTGIHSYIAFEYHAEIRKAAETRIHGDLRQSQLCHQQLPPCNGQALLQNVFQNGHPGGLLKKVAEVIFIPADVGTYVIQQNLFRSS